MRISTFASAAVLASSFLTACAPAVYVPAPVVRSSAPPRVIVTEEVPPRQPTYVSPPPTYVAPPPPSYQQPTYQYSSDDPEPLSVDTMPPPLVEEDPGYPLYAGAEWVPGFWDWNGYWDWRPGQWASPPSYGWGWTSPYYEFRGGRVIYVRGHWGRPGHVFAPPPPGRYYAPAPSRPGGVIGAPPPRDTQGSFVPPPPGSRPGGWAPRPTVAPPPPSYGGSRPGTVAPPPPSYNNTMPNRPVVPPSSGYTAPPPSYNNTMPRQPVVTPPPPQRPVQPPAVGSTVRPPPPTSVPARPGTSTVAPSPPARPGTTTVAPPPSPVDNGRRITTPGRPQKRPDLPSQGPISQ